MIRVLFGFVPPEHRGAVRRYGLLLGVVIVLRAAACVVLVPLLGRLLSDDPGAAMPWIVAFVVAAVVHGVCQHRLARLAFDLGLHVTRAVQEQMVDRLTRVPVGWPVGARRARIQRTLSSTATSVAQTIGNLVTPLAIAVTLPVAIGVGLLFVSWPLGLTALAMVPILLAAWWAADRSARRADEAFAASVAGVDDRIVEFAQVQRALRAAGRTDPDHSRVGEALDEQRSATVSLLKWSLPGQLLFSVVTQLALIALAAMSLWRLQRGEVTVPEALGLIVVIARYLEPFTSLGELAPTLTAAGGAMRGVDEILRAPIVAGSGDDATGRLGDGPPEVRFEEVSFRYPNATRNSADGVSFVAPAGATTAIVGPSGAGKSTLLSLLARFADADAGRIVVGGNDLRSVDADDYYRNLSVVFQAVHLFEGSIADNVALGRAGAADAALAAAAREARVDEIIERLPAGWNTPVGEGGIALSGGERQRVGIARALLKDAPLLLVDEATSSLDVENEGAIAAALAAGRGRRTTIVVAHRMHTIDQADHIVFVDQGRVVEQGPRDELLRAGGRFAAFHEDRSASASWKISNAASSPTRSPAPQHP